MIFEKFKGPLSCLRQFLTIEKQKEVSNQSPYLIFCITFRQKYFSRYILLTDQISLSDCLYFLRCWVICVLQLIDVHSVTSKFLKLTIAFLSNHFSIQPKRQDKIVNIRSSRPYVFREKGVLRNFAKFTEKHLCQSRFF